jgi:proton-dependent oligopeptide transporter, POT family
MYLAEADVRIYPASVSTSATTVGDAGARPGRWLQMLREQPAGLYLVAITEFWERFSYWGMLGLLVLFLTAPVEGGGFGWNTADALWLYALYTGAVFAAPAVGGYLASRYFGERRCILWGGVGVAAGHLLLTGPAVLPALTELVTGHAVGSWLRSCGIPLGQIAPAPEVTAALHSGRCAMDPAGSAALTFAHGAQAWSFMLGLALIVIGTGFIKSTVSSIVGKLYPADDHRREDGFAIFMAFIYLGALSSNFVAGTLGELLGWHYGFAAAGLGMVGGLVWYVARHRKVLGNIGERPDRDQALELRAQATAAEQRIERGRIAVAVIMSAFVVIYAMAFYQKGGLLNLETRAHADRVVFGFEIPTTWLLSVSTLVFILLTLPVTRLWRSLRERGREPDVVAKLGGGLAMLALSYGLLLVALLQKENSMSQQFSLWWIIAMYCGFAVADLLVWPTQIAAVSRLAPARHAAFAIGSWHLTIGLGSWLTGIFGALGARSGVDVAGVVLLGVCAAAAAIVMTLRPALLRLSQGALERPPAQR